VLYPQIAAFPRLGKDNTPPVRALAGQKTLISRTMHGIGYDERRDEIVATSPLAQAILFFRGNANGEEAPLRVIAGPHTQIQGRAYEAVDRLTVDSVNSEVYLPVEDETKKTDNVAILVFDSTANGDVPPKRVLRGVGYGSIAVDPVHNVMIVNATGDPLPGDTRTQAPPPPPAPRTPPSGPRDTSLPFQGVNGTYANYQKRPGPPAGERGQGQGAGGPRRVPQLRIYDRLANGNDAPLRIISGPKTGLQGGLVTIQVTAKGWILAAGGNNNDGDRWIGAWSVNDNGDVPPRWKIPVQKLTGYGPYSVGIDPPHKEMLMSVAGGTSANRPPRGVFNGVYTWSWPEIF